MADLHLFEDVPDDAPPPRWQDQVFNQRSLGVQAVISIVFGMSAFLTFCALRPRWTELYNARKKQSSAASRLPDLPKTMFTWIPVVWGISEAEVLASAGLDAYAFLAFFDYAIKYLSITLFFSLVIILPINYKFTGRFGYYPEDPGNSTMLYFNAGDKDGDGDIAEPGTGYLWMYVAFVYFLTGLAIYLLIGQTKKMITIRQAYLGTQSTVTDRTIRLSGIPPDLQSEEKIKFFIEELNIGKVDSVMLCRHWAKLDKTVAKRTTCLRRLEESWAIFLGQNHPKRNERHPPPNPEVGPEDDEEDSQLLSRLQIVQSNGSSYDQRRPLHTIRYGALNLKSRQVDAIDYFEEKLRKYDENITELRKKEFKPTALAFVTMESTAACQMAVQAKLDPNPGRMLATLAPAPADVVWENTYMSRAERMARSWTIMFLIGVLSIFWAALLIPLAGLLSTDAIETVLPGAKDALNAHPIGKSLVQSGLPTLIFSLLSVAVPFLYDWLSNLQGATSQGEVELSIISKNFFFTFFNLFIVFTIWGTASKFLDFWQNLQDILKDTAGISYALAKSLEQLSPFYVNLIVLQAFGLFPFRLLEFGSVSVYPFYLISAKTPRDYAELTRPPIFSYGFYLPQTILIFIMCLVYSVLPSSWLITLFGLIYFFIGGFIYKYQLLYAMDHRPHSRGQAWPMICDRIVVGLVVFQLAMLGNLALKGAFTGSVFVIPVIASTFWFYLYFERNYRPLMTYIALRSIDRGGVIDLPSPTQSPWDRDTDHGRTVDTTPETGLRYINPNLISPLERAWVNKSQVASNRRDSL